ncbi:hypothetical protein OG216_38295 [Streptomycetaceae bacterium NBC_01309]
MRSWLLVGAVVLVLLAAGNGTDAHAGAEHRQGVPYEASGTPTNGSAAGCASAPTLRPGQYVDKLIAGQNRWYRVDKRPDQVLEVSATAVYNAAVSASSTLSVGAGWGEGDDPRSWLFDQTAHQGGPILSAGGRANAKSLQGTSACVRIGNGIATPATQKIPMPVELVVKFTDSVLGAPQVPVGSRIDGFTFAGARAVDASGLVRGNLAVGEYPVWRVEVKNGQTLSVRGVLDHAATLSTGTTERFTVRVFNGVREAMRCSVRAGATPGVPIKKGSTHTEQECGPWGVDQGRARTESEYDLPGTYYLMVGVDGVELDDEGLVLPYDLNVLVTGEPKAAAPDGGTSSRPESQSGGNTSGGAATSGASAGASTAGGSAPTAGAASESGAPGSTAASGGPTAGASGVPGKPGADSGGAVDGGNATGPAGTGDNSYILTSDAAGAAADADRNTVDNALLVVASVSALVSVCSFIVHRRRRDGTTPATG